MTREEAEAAVCKTAQEALAAEEAAEALAEKTKLAKREASWAALIHRAAVRELRAMTRRRPA